MRLQGFKCDRCGKVVTDMDFCKLGHSEVGEEFLSDFEGLGKMELCDDCYEEFVQGMRNFIAGYMSYFGSGRSEEDEE
jgi:hypothetical protein